MRYFLDDTWATILSRLVSIYIRRNATHCFYSMSPIPSRLQTLSELRRNAEAEKKRLYAAAALRRATAEEQLAELENQWSAASKNLSAERTRQREPVGPHFVSEGMARIHYLQRLSNLVHQAHEAVQSFRKGPLAEALANEEAARQVFIEARKELEMVLKLEEREKLLQKKHHLQREEIAQEEHVEAMFGKVRPSPKP